MRRVTVLASVVGLAAATLTVVAPTSPASGVSADTCAARTNDTIKKLLACVTLSGVREHQAALQAIADANGGTRAVGTPGYAASVAYASDVLESAGYRVTLQPFDFTFVPDAVLQQIAPVAGVYETGSFTGGGVGEVTASVTPVDINLTPPRASTSGCEAADFAGFPAGSIALIQRGTCTFAIKALNAQAAGASAVVIFNQGNDPTREGLIVGTLAPDTATIPVVGASFAAGTRLSEPGSTARIKVDPNETRTTYNVIAETRAGSPDNVVMVGAHLDSVRQGPGINDNGSGVAAILETAQQMAKVAPRNKVRFALWGGEELGLLGSDHYVSSLSDADRARVTMYLNFDMIGSPNYVRFVYDGDGSAFGLVGPPGSKAIENYFVNFYGSRGLASEPTEISFRSDYAAFFDAGIPFGGLFTGAEGVKSPAQAAVFGGTAGQSYDPCYHLACDTFANVSTDVLALNSDAVAASTLKFAMSTQSVNGVKGKGNFQAPAHDDGSLPTQ